MQSYSTLSSRIFYRQSNTRQLWSLQVTHLIYRNISFKLYHFTKYTSVIVFYINWRRRHQNCEFVKPLALQIKFDKSLSLCQLCFCGAFLSVLVSKTAGPEPLSLSLHKYTQHKSPILYTRPPTSTALCMIHKIKTT